MALIGSSCRRVVVGLGKTGMSCVRFLAQKGTPFSVIDSRQEPPGLKELVEQLPEVPVFLGGFDVDVLMAADELVVSPGISLAQPEITHAIAHGVKAIGDIELFCREIGEKPVIAITGSNGKSTVTTLLGCMARQAGLKVAVGGNIGTPVLDLLDNDVDLYVLELSSFQLETTHSLQASAATVLNLSPDHMDRYASVVEYHAAKHRIYRNCKSAVYNLDDSLTTPLIPSNIPAVGFTSKKPDLGQYGLQAVDGSYWLCRGHEKLLDTSNMRILGRHNHMNALAALALGEAAGIELKAMLEALERFPGLAHRCQWVAEANGVSWFNDSKATNVGACIAAIEGLGTEIAGKLILIAGGDGKGADFSELQPPVSRYVRKVILIGRDAPLIEKQLEGWVSIDYAKTLEAAVIASQEASTEGDAILLAPACASFDMFDSFEQRGERFVRLVKNLLEKETLC